MAPRIGRTDNGGRTTERRREVCGRVEGGGTAIRARSNGLRTDAEFRPYNQSAGENEPDRREIRSRDSVTISFPVQSRRRQNEKTNPSEPARRCAIAPDKAAGHSFLQNEPEPVPACSSWPKTLYTSVVASTARRVSQPRSAIDYSWLQNSHRAGEQRPLGRLDGRGRADMHPEAFQPQPEQPSGRCATVEQRRHGARCRRRIGQERRRENGRAGIDEGNDFPLRPAREPAVGGHCEISTTVVADARRGRCDQKQRIHADRIKAFGQQTKIGLYAVDPDRVGIDVKERITAQQRQGLDHSAGSAEQLAPLIRDDNGRVGAGSEMPLDQIGKVMDVYDNALDLLLRQPVERIIDEGLAGDLDQWLRHLLVERLHARSQPGSERHGALGFLSCSFTHRVWALKWRSGPAHGQYTMR